MYNIVIIGAGQIGSRHLQGLALLNCEANIYVIDKSTNSLEVAKQRFEEVYCINNVKLQIDYITTIDSLPDVINLAIIATTSDTRREIVELLGEKKIVSYFILEKVLFNRVEDYYAIQSMLSAKGIKAWVNCSRRGFECYKQLRILFQDESSVQFTVEGTNWGLGCNSIHFIDVFAYILNCKPMCTIDVSDVDNKILSSKRNGFIEFTGTLSGCLENNNTFRLTSRAMDTTEFMIRITSQNYDVIIDEKNSVMVVKRSCNDWTEELFHIHIPFQSQITNKMVEEILITGRSQLPSYQESMSLHLPLIEGLLSKLNQDGMKTDICNIT